MEPPRRRREEKLKRWGLLLRLSQVSQSVKYKLGTACLFIPGLKQKIVE